MEAQDIFDLSDDELQLEYDEKCDEVVELKQELRATRLEAQQLHLRLRCAQKATGKSIGETSSLPGAVPTHALQTELSSLLFWLAANVDLDKPCVVEAGVEVPVGGRKVQLRTVVVWPVGAGSLRLSVPLAQREEVSAMLQSASSREEGQVDNDCPLLRSFAASWDLVPGQLGIGPESRAEPVVLLAHRFSDEGMLIAPWPRPKALETTVPLRLEAAATGSPQPGERIEVDYQGCWYTGTLMCIDAVGNAKIQCDADPLGVMTIGPMCSVRRRLVPSREVLDTAAAPHHDSSDACARPVAVSHRRTRSAM